MYLLQLLHCFLAIISLLRLEKRASSCCITSFWDSFWDFWMLSLFLSAFSTFPLFSALLFPPLRCDCYYFGGPEGLDGSSTRDVNGPNMGGARVFFFAELLLSLLSLFFIKILGSRRYILLNYCSNCLLACLFYCFYCFSYRSRCFLACLFFRSRIILRFIN